MTEMPDPVPLLRLSVLAIPQEVVGDVVALMVGIGLPDDPPPPWVTAREVCDLLRAGLTDGSIQANLEQAWTEQRAAAN